MLAVVLFFLFFSLLIYVLLAGADFGAGIVELFSSSTNQKITKKTIYRVMGPVWEANHIWIIILIVILWVGFPSFYHIITIYLHIPLTLVLLGITLRGVAFIFRHYDAFIDESQIVYDWIFRISSLITPIFLGMTFGAIISGDIETDMGIHSHSFMEVYVYPWFSVFTLLIGLFFAALCSFLASVLLIGECDKSNLKIFTKKARIASISVIFLGFVVLVYGYIREVHFISSFLQNTTTIVLVLISAILILPLFISIKNGRRIWSRALAGIQVVLILFSAFYNSFPNLIYTTSSAINIVECAAPQEVIRVLAISLIIGGLVILPGLFHLLKSFKMIKLLDR